MLSSESKFSIEDRDLLIDILSQLTRRDREAVLLFYVDGHEEHQIEAELDLNPGHLQELRRSVRAAFSERKAARLRKT